MSNTHFDFSGQHIFVSGGTSGINLSIACAFGEAGAKLSVIGRNPERGAEAVKAIEGTGAKAQYFSADVRDDQVVQDVLGKSAESFGPINVIVAGAAGNFPAPVLGMSARAFKSVVDIDLLGTFNVVRFGHPHLAPQGSVIAISAPQAQIPSHLQSHVAAAKAGVEAFIRNACLEWGPQGIRLNAIVPGPIEGTEGMKRLAPTEELRVVIRDTIPLRRWGTGEDVANLALFLSSPYASYINGAVVPVDGGWSNGGFSGASDALLKHFVGG